MMKEQLCTTVGMVGGFIAALLGGWDTGLQTLMILIGIDYLTGLIVAGVFHKSTKTKNGALESKAGFHRGFDGVRCTAGEQAHDDHSGADADRADGVPVRYADSCELHT